MSADQTAYKVTSAEIANVVPTFLVVPPHAEPAAGWVVHQLAKVYPGLVNEPLFAATVTDTPDEYAEESTGTDPPPLPFPL